ncbi:COMM domain-containing protein 1 [Lampetra fluviatilis]
MAQAGGGVDAGGIRAEEPLGALLSGVVDLLFGEEKEAKAVAVSEEALRGKLYPDTTRDDFKALLSKMKGLLKAMATADMDSTQLETFLAAQVRKPGGVTAEQAAILARFWKSHRGRVRESLVARCRWEPTLHSVNWRVDVPAANGHSGDQSGAPIAFLELDIGHEGQEPERLSLELDEAGIAKIMKSVTAIEQRIAKLGQ